MNVDELLQAAVAPWDEKSWERLRESHPTAAGALASAVARGLTEQQVRDYCARWGYLEWVGHWLAQAVAHLRRVAAEAAETVDEPEAAPDGTDAPTAADPLPEEVRRGRVIADAQPTAARRHIADAGGQG